MMNYKYQHILTSESWVVKLVIPKKETDEYRIYMHDSGETIGNNHPKIFQKLVDIQTHFVWELLIPRHHLDIVIFQCLRIGLENIHKVLLKNDVVNTCDLIVELSNQASYVPNYDFFVNVKEYENDMILVLRPDTEYILQDEFIFDDFDERVFFSDSYLSSLKTMLRLGVLLYLEICLKNP